MNNKKIITATLLISDGSIEHEYFHELLGIEIDELLNLFKEINLQLEDLEFGFEIKYDNKKSDIVTVNEISTYLKDVKPPSVIKGLSTPALETLAIIAYHQPVTRAEIEDIRGVTVSSGTIDTLLQMNWVKIKGRRKVPGNPIAYGTTEEFLVHFDLQSIKDLPDMQELKSMGLLDNNLPPDLYPENLLNNDDIEEIDDINSNKVDGEF